MRHLAVMVQKMGGSASASASAEIAEVQDALLRAVGLMDAQTAAQFVASLGELSQGELELLFRALAGMDDVTRATFLKTMSGMRTSEMRTFIAALASVAGAGAGFGGFGGSGDGGGGDVDAVINLISVTANMSPKQRNVALAALSNCTAAAEMSEETRKVGTL